MERLASTKYTWYTRRVGNWTLLCFYVSMQAGSLMGPQRILCETVIGRPPIRVVQPS